MKKEGFILSFQWLELYRRQLWVGILFAFYSFQFLSLLFNRIDLQEWIMTGALIIVVAINHWRMEKIISLFDQYQGMHNTKLSSYLFPSKIRWLVFFLGLPIGYGLVFIFPNLIIITIIVIITLFDFILIAFSMLNKRLNDWLGYYTPNGSRHELLGQRPGLNLLVKLGKSWQRLINLTNTHFNTPLAWLMMIIARLLRIRKEGVVIRCQYQDCTKQFENPKLQCHHQIGEQSCSGQVQTWPTLAAPLFTVCNQHLYLAWQPVAELVASSELSFKDESCQFGSNCQNFGLNQGRRFYKVMLICFEATNTALALEKIGDWFGTIHNAPKLFVQMTQSIKHQKPIRLPRRAEVFNLETQFVKLEVTLFNPLTNKPLWAGDYDWVVIVPRYRGQDKEQLATEVKFALGRIELPATPTVKNQAPYQSPSILTRLFYPPINEELATERSSSPMIGIWSYIELKHETHFMLPLNPVLYTGDFEKFIRGLRE